MLTKGGYTIRVAIFYGYNSYRKALEPIANDLEKQKIEVVWHHLELVDFNIKKYSKALYAQYDACFLGVGGHHLLQILEAYKFQKNMHRRPILLTLFPGIRNANDRLGYVIRAISDIILLGTVPDFEEYENMSLMPRSIAKPMLMGFPQLISQPTWQYDNQCRNIIFYYQSSILNYTEINFLAQSILNAADKNCFNKIFIVRKNIDNDAHIQNERDNIFFDYLKSHKNIIIKFSDKNLLVQRCFTISSTKSLETIKYGCPTFYPDNFGFLYEKGNIFYKNSGLTACLTQILDLNVPLQEPCDYWLETHMIDYFKHKNKILNILKNMNNLENNIPKHVYFMLKVQIYFIKKIEKIKNKFLRGI